MIYLIKILKYLFSISIAILFLTHIMQLIVFFILSMMANANYLRTEEINLNDILNFTTTEATTTEATNNDAGDVYTTSPTGLPPIVLDYCPEKL